MGLVWAVNHFRVFTSITHHHPLKLLKSFKDSTGRIARWLMILIEYQWNVEHKRGREHGHAYGLSRRRTDGAGPEEAGVYGRQRVEELLPPLAERGAEGVETEKVNAVSLRQRWSMRELAGMQAEDPLLGRVQQLLKDGKEPHPSMLLHRLPLWRQRCLRTNSAFARSHCESSTSVTSWFGCRLHRMAI